jgi:hypothetical protein
MSTPEPDTTGYREGVYPSALSRSVFAWGTEAGEWLLRLDSNQQPSG